MKGASYHILRVGLAITFLWIGVLILRDPLLWAGFVEPSRLALLPLFAGSLMKVTAFLDIVTGLLLLLDYRTAWAAGWAALHLTGVLALAGLNNVTTRDIGLLAVALALLVETTGLKRLLNKL